MGNIFIEAESFRNLGGWVIDSTSSEVMGSAYLMAHGLGCPVDNAKSNFTVEEDGEYSVFARTRDWTATFHRGTPAGLFKILIDGQDFGCSLGNNGAEWAWQNSGRIALAKGEHSIELVDLTGFNGRCDAIFISKDVIPPNGQEELKAFRDSFVAKAIIEDSETYDLIVIGGGIAGICVALTAFRKKMKVLLIEEQDVLGGCNSSNIRVCMGGSIHLPPYKNIGRIVKEIAPVMGLPSLYDKKYFEDDRKLNAFDLYEDGCFGRNKVLLSSKLEEVDCVDGVISAVIVRDIKTGKKTKYHSTLFCDCSGDGVLARLCGASYMYGRESRDTFNESCAPLTHENLVMGHSIRWCSELCETEQFFPDIDFAIPMDDTTCLHALNGDWEQEVGFRRDMLKETEYIRDYGLLSIFSTWSYQKNHSARKDEYKNYRLKWVSHLGGKRESCRIVGDYILTQNDIENYVEHEDGTASLSWSIDMHFPEADNERDFGEAFRSFAYHRGFAEPYPVPYRCLYSKEISNLFLGGRIVSMSHIAFSSVRVMRTLGSLGEVVGLAAYICNKHKCYPRDVYATYLEEFKEELEMGVPSPDAFHGGLNPNESYHFKDAGWVDTPITEAQLDACPYKEKVIRNIKRLKIRSKFRGCLDED